MAVVCYIICYRSNNGHVSFPSCILASNSWVVCCFLYGEKKVGSCIILTVCFLFVVCWSFVVCWLFQLLEVLFSPSHAWDSTGSKGLLSRRHHSAKAKVAERFTPAWQWKRTCFWPIPFCLKVLVYKLPPSYLVLYKSYKRLKDDHL